MPRNKKYTKKRRRRRSRIPYTISQRSNSIVADRQIVRMTYVQRTVLDPGVTGVSATNVFSANGLYDVDITGSGTQPLGFDQWMPFYNHYVVLGSKCSVTYTPVAADGTTGSMISAISLKSSSTTGPTQIDRDLEYQHTVYRMSGSAAANNGVMLNKRCSVKRFLGRANPLSDPALKGTISTNPTEQAYFHVTVAPINDGYNLGAVNTCVRIEYIVALIEPKLLPSS